jgi:hypothetical protein
MLATSGFGEDHGAIYTRIDAWCAEKNLLQQEQVRPVTLSSIRELAILFDGMYCSARI